jgi:hypothetical protein
MKRRTGPTPRTNNEPLEASQRELELDITTGVSGA